MSQVDGPLLECVPNFSEGRRPEVLDALCQAIADVPDARVLHRTLDPDHHRSVITFVAPPDAAVAAAVAAVGAAARLIDLRAHQGVHPRLGAADVVPFIPLLRCTMETCVEVARRCAERIGDQLEIPAFCYGEAALRPDRANLASLRRPRFEGLGDLMGRDPDWRPDFGPAKIHPSAGATAVGARFFLVAFNVDLCSEDLELARGIARRVRESSGGLVGIKALGLKLAARSRVQVSMNVCDFRQTSLPIVYAAVERLAREAGVEIAASEIIGLVPQAALAGVDLEALSLPPEVMDQVIERRLS